MTDKRRLAKLDRRIAAKHYHSLRNTPDKRRTTVTAHKLLSLIADDCDCVTLLWSEATVVCFNTARIIEKGCIGIVDVSPTRFESLRDVLSYLKWARKVGMAVPRRVLDAVSMAAVNEERWRSKNPRAGRPSGV